MRLSFFVAAALLAAQSAGAATLSDIDVPNLVFDIQNQTTPQNAQGVATYTGVSGSTGSTVGFTVTSFAPLTSTTDTVGFNFGATVPSLGTQDFEHLHINRYVVDFDSAVTSLLIFAQNDNGDGPGIDFGFAPSDFGGATTQTGTSFTVNTPNQASYLLYEFAATTSISFAATGNAGGWDSAFFANVAPMAPIPLPAAGWMLLAGIGSFAAMRRRKKA